MLALKEKHMLRNNKGMTLLEIMIVLVILGGLIGILATKVTGRLKAARVNQAKIQIGEYGKYLDMFYTDCGYYPPADLGLRALVEPQSNCSNWGPDPYIKRVSKDPWNNDYIYEVQGGTYVLRSLGADKVEGGSGDGADISSENL